MACNNTKLNLYGEYVALITGPFGNLSSDFSTLVDFIARERAMKTMELRDIKPVLALAIHRCAADLHAHSHRVELPHIYDSLQRTHTPVLSLTDRSRDLLITTTVNP